MELNGFNSDDYIYLRVFEDFTISDRRSNETKYPQGMILRFEKEKLRNDVFSRHFPSIYDFDITENPEVSKDAIMPYDLYTSIKFREDKQLSICLWPDETYSLSAWLMKKITSGDRPMISFFDFEKAPTKVGRDIDSIKKSPATIDDENRILTVGKRNIDLYLDFKAGEELNFKNLDIASLFLDQDLMKILAHCESITDTEKETLFEKDFKYTFKDGNHFYQFYELKPEIKVKTERELWKTTGFYSLFVDIVRDNNGYIRYVYFREYDTISQNAAAKILEYATPLSVEEGRDHLAEIRRQASIREEEERRIWAEKLAKEKKN